MQPPAIGQCSSSFLDMFLMRCLQMALIPVVAAHKGTYHCYLTSWCIAAHLAAAVFVPLLNSAPGVCEKRHHQLAQAASAVMSTPADGGDQLLSLCQQWSAAGQEDKSQEAVSCSTLLMQWIAAGAVEDWVWKPLNSL